MRTNRRLVRLWMSVLALGLWSAAAEATWAGSLEEEGRILEQLESLAQERLAHARAQGALDEEIARPRSHAALVPLPSPRHFHLPPEEPIAAAPSSRVADTWDPPGFAKRYQRPYNVFADGYAPDNPRVWTNDINSAFNPVNQTDPGNPLNPLNMHNVENPFNPVNRHHPANPLTYPDSPNLPFVPLQ